MPSRDPRGNEVEGKDYFFVTKDEFEKKDRRRCFLEYATYNGHYYGTPKEKIDEYLSKGIDVILVIDIQGALSIKKNFAIRIICFYNTTRYANIEKTIDC